MAERLEVEVKKQLSNFVQALIALAPSRNYVTQFLYLVKVNGSIDYRILEEAYPDIVKDEYVRDSFAKAFGISFKDKVYLESGKFGDFLVGFIDRVLQLFEDPEFRSKINSLLKEEYPQGVPNLAQEWLEVRLKGLSSEPTYGKVAVKVLREIVRVQRAKTEELEKSLGISRGEVIEATNLLKLYGLVKEDPYGFTPSESLRKYPQVLEGI
jgi:hypothetical protein